ncbi:hypothetical protein F5Y16DRAFT_353253 [Xylariaceae sp. FL0255]|nr:hypothetical protein F5Y16DRAFT_353253 [Xylariaceae sp. FL0255]
MITPRSFIYTRRPSPPSSTSSPTLTPRATTPTHSPPKRLSYDNPFENSKTVQKPIIIGTKKSPTPDTVSPPTRSPSSTVMATVSVRPITPSSAVQIPRSQNHNHKSRKSRDAHSDRSSSARRTRDVHSPDAIPPAVAALLAITNIPPPSRKRSLRQRDMKEARMTVDSIVPRSRVSEKDLSHELSFDVNEQLDLDSFERSPLELLLSPPDELDEEDTSSLQSDSCFASPFSTRDGSFDSLPSLGDSLSTTAKLSADFPSTPRGGKSRSPRRSLEPVTSPPGQEPADPLSKMSIDKEPIDFGTINAKPVIVTGKQSQVLTPFRSVFKSNLTASLRALRSAARSLSTFTASSIPPEDLLTRSLLTIDPRVPFTDERRPPVLEEEPSEAMRRYLNPTGSLGPESRGSPSIRSYTASIQMQTYKVQRSRGVPRIPRPTSQTANVNKSTVVLPPTGPRQREMRENSDFIRIALMEHLMRKHGKFDEQREGHARWLLPPRKANTKLYEIGAGGVPVRWIPTVQGEA